MLVQPVKTTLASSNECSLEFELWIRLRMSVDAGTQTCHLLTALGLSEKDRPPWSGKQKPDRRYRVTIAHLRCLCCHSLEHFNTSGSGSSKFPGSIKVPCGAVTSGSLESDATNSLASHSSSLHSATAAFDSATKGAGCCPSPVAFRFAVGKKASSVCQKAAARSRTLFFTLERPGIADRYIYVPIRNN